MNPLPLYLQFHLGLGDALLCNGLVRHLAEQRPVIVPAKFHNLPSVNFMFRDNPRIRTVGVRDDADADNIRHHAGDTGGIETLSLGMFGKGFDWARWDESLFEQAGVDVEKRWEKWFVQREPAKEVKPPTGKYVFVHDDIERGFIIDPSRLPDLPMVRAHKRETIFDWWGVIENATEVHLIDSAFLMLSDLIPRVTADRLVLHRYATNAKYGNSPAQEPTILRRYFEVIR